MFNFLFKTIYELEPKALGLDISDLSLKIVKLEIIKKKIKLVDFIETEIPKGIIEKGIIRKEADLTKIIKEAFEKLNYRKKFNHYVVCSLPEQETFLKIIKIPKVKQEQIKELVYKKIISEIPINIPDFYLDWEIINDDNAEEKEYLKIITVAIDKIVAEPYIRVIEGAGLKIKALELESQALVRSIIPKNSLEDLNLIIDFGATATGLTIFSQRNINFTSTIPISGSDLEKAIINKFGISEEGAKKLKIEVGLDRSKNNGEVFNSLKPIIDDLIQKIQDYINYYSRSNNQEVKIKKIILAGGDANLIGLNSYMKQKLKIDTEISNPLVNIYEENTLKETPKIPFNKSLKYAVAIGLALRDFQN